MIGHASEKVLKQWQKAPVALRLVVEYLDEKFGGGLLVFRIDAPTKFEKGVHAAGLAMDLELRGDAQAIERACLEVNKRFFPRGPGVQVCTIKENLANFPSGRRADRPHVHVQIPFDWKANPRLFLREHGYTEGKDCAR